MVQDGCMAVRSTSLSLLAVKTYCLKTKKDPGEEGDLEKEIYKKDKVYELRFAKCLARQVIKTTTSTRDTEDSSKEDSEKDDTGVPPVQRLNNTILCDFKITFWTLERRLNKVFCI